MLKYVYLFFCDPVIEIVEGASITGEDRIELYTEAYAKQFATGNKQNAIEPYINSANHAKNIGLGLNAGHDLDLNNLNFLKKNILFLNEVSIGHALICDAIYLGFENTIQLYKRKVTV